MLLAKKTLYGTVCGLMSMALLGCMSQAEDDVEALWDDAEHPVIFDVSFEEPTRALTDGTRTQFAFYAYNSRTAKGKNVIYTRQPDNSWAGPLVTWPKNDGVMNFFALAPSFENVSNLNMTWKVHTFDYLLPNGNYPDFWYASNIKTTESKSGGLVKLNFVAAFAYFTFTCRQHPTNLPVSDYTVNVKSIKMHNISSRGQFEFLETGSNKAAWTPYTEDADYIYYEQEFSSPVTLTGSYATLTDSAIVCIPQTITKWTTKAGAPVPLSYADANHHCYVELECQVINKDGDYVWGSKDGTGRYPMYESVFIPFPYNKAYAINSRTTLRITFDGGFDRDGMPTIFHREVETHLDVNVDQWIDEESPVDVEL